MLCCQRYVVWVVACIREMKNMYLLGFEMQAMWCLHCYSRDLLFRLSQMANALLLVIGNDLLLVMCK